MLNERCAMVLQSFLEEHNRNPKHLDGIYNKAKRKCKSNGLVHSDFIRVCESLSEQGYLKKEFTIPIESKINRGIVSEAFYCLTEAGLDYNFDLNGIEELPESLKNTVHGGTNNKNLQ